MGSTDKKSKKRKVFPKNEDAENENKRYFEAINSSSSAATRNEKHKDYMTTRRQWTATAGENGTDRRCTGGMGLECDMTVNPDLNVEMTSSQITVNQNNRNFIEYFIRLSHSPNESVNLVYITSLLNAGCDINCGDKYGQTIFHEVARAWHVDMAKFLIENHADINKGDHYGRTPLHVAAAVDYPELVELLILCGANKEALTEGEHQTPVHFAAKSDSCKSLKTLIQHDCDYKLVRDYKGRTPLLLAAELDRSETARFLLELDDPAPAGVEDDSGNYALTWMISKMPSVAKLALNQFHTTDRANRKQAYHMHKLEPGKPIDRKGHARSPMQTLVIFKRYDLVEHTAFLYLINLKWQKFGRFGAVLNFVLNAIFILLWTFVGVFIGYDEKYLYVLPSQWWRIVLLVYSLDMMKNTCMFYLHSGGELSFGLSTCMFLRTPDPFDGIFAVGFTGWQLTDELREYIKSKKGHTDWEEWKLKQIESDMKYAHPRWPEERQYLEEEQKNIKDQRPQYLNDFWNIFDWMCYALLVICLVTHFVDVGRHTNFVARLHIRMMSVTIILLWVRILKNARAFQFSGPFIVMLTKMVGDVGKFILLYLVFYIPFSCAFWMMFGGTKVQQKYQDRPDSSNYTVQVIGMENYDALLFSLFRITLVDNYDYEGMKTVDSLMADILCGFWLGVSAILMINLFIALMSDTFQRVYDNAKAIALMQKAITIMSYEETLSKKHMNNFLTLINKSYAPKIESYDDDDVNMGAQELQLITLKIKEQLDVLEDKFNDHLPEIMDDKSTTDESVKGDKSSRNVLQDELELMKLNMKTHQDKMMNHMKREMKALRDMLLVKMDQINTDGKTSNVDGHLSLHTSTAYNQSRDRTHSVPHLTDRPYNTGWEHDRQIVRDQPDVYQGRHGTQHGPVEQIMLADLPNRPYPTVEVSDQDVTQSTTLSH